MIRFHIKRVETSGTNSKTGLGTVAYETIVPTIIRKPVVGLEEQHVTIQQIGSSAGPTILQVGWWSDGG